MVILETIFYTSTAYTTKDDLFQNKKKVLLKKFSMCKGKENLPMQWRNIQAKNTADGETFVHGQVVVISEISTNLSVS